MEHPGFYKRSGPFSLRQIAEATGAVLADDVDADQKISDVLTLQDAQQGHVSFLDNPKYIPQLKHTKASACFVSPKHQNRVPQTVIALVSPQPYVCFGKSLFLFYPEAGYPQTTNWGDADRSMQVHPTARLEEGVVIEPGAVVGAEAVIGAGTRIASGAVIGYRVSIGRNGYVGPNAVITHALIGDRVIIHSGVTIGQDGFGFAMGPSGHFKIPQIGRVIIQDDVEIGANSAIDRGALKDTIIGQGTKIDNLVQIAHNVVMGRHCVIAAEAGISGSCELGDFVVLGGQVGIIGHLRIGSGAQIAAKSGLMTDMPAGERWGGSPAKPLRQWHREVLALKNLISLRKKAKNPD